MNYSIITSPWPWVLAGFEYHVIQRNETTHDSIFHMSVGMQGVHSQVIGVASIDIKSTINVYIIHNVTMTLQLPRMPGWDISSDIPTTIWNIKEIIN